MASTSMQDFLKFRVMITPLIIQAIFWIASGIFVLVGLFTLFTAEGAAKFGGLLVIFLGPLAVRIYAEIMLVAFRMNENLEAIRKHQGA